MNQTSWLTPMATTASVILSQAFRLWNLNALYRELSFLPIAGVNYFIMEKLTNRTSAERYNLPANGFRDGGLSTQYNGYNP